MVKVIEIPEEVEKTLPTSIQIMRKFLRQEEENKEGDENV